MAYYQPPLSQFQTSGTVGGNITNANGVNLTSVNPNELTSYQLGQLQNSNNPLVQQAVRRSQSFAANRGSGLDSAQYADAATGAAFDAMTPIAAQDAGQYASVRDANQAALNANQLEGMRNTTSIMTANIGAGAQMYGDDVSARTAGENRTWQTGRDAAQHGYSMEDAATQHGYNQEDAAQANRYYMGNAAYNTILSDPAYWSNPQASLNMAHTFMNGFDQIYDGTSGGGNPRGGGSSFGGPRP